MKAIFEFIKARFEKPPALELAYEKRRLEAVCRECGLSRSHASAIVVKFFANREFK